MPLPAGASLRATSLSNAFILSTPVLRDRRLSAILILKGRLRIIGDGADLKSGWAPGTPSRTLHTWWYGTTDRAATADGIGAALVRWRYGPAQEARLGRRLSLRTLFSESMNDAWPCLNSIFRFT